MEVTAGDAPVQETLQWPPSAAPVLISEFQLSFHSQFLPAASEF